MHTRRITPALIAAVPSVALAAGSIPNDFEAAPDALLRQFSYFGGVAGFNATIDTAHEVYSGASLRLDANFQPDPFFPIAGFGVGSSVLAGGALSVEPGADTLSITVESPAQGTLALIVSIREDDNGDGIVDVASDDEWESDPIMLAPGVNVYNVPVAALVDVNPGDGNDAPNFTTTGALSYTLTFETRAVFPGGQVTVPVSFHIDHFGLFAGAQSLPGGLFGDLNGDGVVDTPDLGLFIAAFGTADPGADLNDDGVVNTADFGLLLAVFGTSR